MGFAWSAGLLPLAMVCCVSTRWVRLNIIPVAGRQFCIDLAAVCDAQASWSLGPVLMLKLQGVQCWVMRDEVSAADWAALHRNLRLSSTRAD